MRRDVLEAAKEIILANQSQVDLDCDLVVEGEAFSQSSDQAGLLCGTFKAKAGLAVWICFAAAEQYDYPFGVDWEQAAIEAAELSPEQAQALFDVQVRTSPSDVKEAVARINRVLAQDEPPASEQLAAVQEYLRDARILLGKAEELAKEIAFSKVVNGQTADAWTSDADSMVCRALLAINHEREAIKKSAAR